MPDRDSIFDPVIAFDATYSVGAELTGVGKYSLALMDGLAAIAPGVRWRRYYRPHRFLRAPWPKRLLLGGSPRGAALFHGLNQRLPQTKRGLAVSTFHDLFVLSGEYSTPEFRQRFAAQAREAAAQSDWIIAVSEFTAGQVERFLGFPRERISVVPHGVHPPGAVVPADQRQPAVLTVGAVQKRKNTRRLIEAFAALPAPWELWVAGSAGYGAQEMLGAAAGQSRVRLLGYVSEEELTRLYQQAAIFAFPSLDEGFGIPVLEAMAHGVPVLTSQASALPEVAGDAAVLVDPESVEAIAKGLTDLIEVEVRREYAARGVARAAEYPWSRAAGMTLEVYRRLLGG